MRLGIIGAMDVEIDGLVKLINPYFMSKEETMRIYCGTLNGLEVVVAKSGIGKVNAASCTNILLYEFDCTHIINTGIAGSLESYISILDTVVASKCAYHDVDCTAFGYPIGMIPQSDNLYYPCDDRLSMIARMSIDSPYVGTIVSGDQFISEESKKEFIRRNFDHPKCVDMESAAIAQVCTQEKIPFVIIRTISDNANADAPKIEYDKFEELAAKKSIDAVFRMSKILSTYKKGFSRS